MSEKVIQKKVDNHLFMQEIRRMFNEEGKKSYAVSFILQDEEKTLNDKQIDKIMGKLIASYEKQLGAKLR